MQSLDAQTLHFVTSQFLLAFLNNTEVATVPESALNILNWPNVGRGFGGPKWV